MANFTPEKCKQIALARLDVVHKWLEFRKQSKNKLQADYDFVKLHNTSNNHLYEILGKISRGSLYRWYAMLSGTEDYGPLKNQTEISYGVIGHEEGIKRFENWISTINSYIRSADSKKNYIFHHILVLNPYLVLI